MRTAAIVLAAFLLVGGIATSAEASPPQCDPDYEYCDPPPHGQPGCGAPPAGGWKQVALWALSCIP